MLTFINQFRYRIQQCFFVFAKTISSLSRLHSEHIFLRLFRIVRKFPFDDIFRSASLTFILWIQLLNLVVSFFFISKTLHMFIVSAFKLSSCGTYICHILVIVFELLCIVYIYKVYSIKVKEAGLKNRYVHYVIQKDSKLSLQKQKHC